MSLPATASAPLQLPSDGYVPPARGGMGTFEVPWLALTVALGMAFSVEVGLVAGSVALGLGSITLVAYIGFELLLFRRTMPVGTPWLVSPVAIASLYTFVLAYGFTNVLFWVPGYVDSLPRAHTAGFEWQSRVLLYALVAACAMWAGFRLQVGARVGQALWRSRFLAAVLRTSYDVRWSVLGLCVVVSMVSRLIQVQLGAYGVLGELSETHLSYQQYLNYGADLGTLALIGLLASVFGRPQPSVGQRLMLAVLVAHEIGWGIVAADKTTTVMPVVLVGMVYYVLQRKIPIRYVAVGVLLLGMSFLVLMPLRQLARDGELADSRSITAVVDAAFDIASSEIRAGTPAASTDSGFGTAVVQRLNDTGLAAVSLRYKNDHPDDPVPKAFASDILLAPVYVLIPRALWPSKPRGQVVGTWFYQTVLGGRSQTTLAGPTPIGYLYFAGGLVAIVLGFLTLGVFQRVVHERFLLATGGGALVVLLAMLGTLGDIPPAFGAVLSQPFRLVPLVLIAQFALFRR